MPLAGGQGEPIRNSELQLTLFQRVGADYAHHTTNCPPEFENLMASLIAINRVVTNQVLRTQTGIELC